MPVLNNYAQRYGADPKPWHFLTGKKEALYLMARNSYRVTALDGGGGPKDFILSELFTWVDHDKHIRGTYDGTDDSDIADLMDDIAVLLAKLPSEQQ